MNSVTLMNMTERGFAFGKGYLEFFLSEKGEVNLTISFYFERVLKFVILDFRMEKKRKRK